MLMMNNMPSSLIQTSPFILYTSPNGDIKLDVCVQNETLWLTQKMMGELFGVEEHTISYHLKEVFQSDELIEDSVARKIRVTAKDGKQYLTNFYNLDAIIAIGYRVNSKRATQFRMWATKVLREYIVKGFVLDDERLKQGKRVFGEDYFKELLERVRSIRASERRIYQQITDIFAECSVDYNPHADVTHDFFATVQNFFHYAIIGQTAAEIIYTSVDQKNPHMGLTTWKHVPSGRILQSDATVAKNYLSDKDIKRLERTISSYFDYIEQIIENKRTFTMKEFAESVRKFLQFHEFHILEGKGRISKEKANAKALMEYKEFNKIQPIKSDFDRLVKRMVEKEK